MQIVVFGGSGLIGQGVLLQSLDHPKVDEVVSIGRRRLDIDHPKLRQIVHRDFQDFSSIADDLTGVDACFWCLGIASSGMDEASYTRITYDFTMAAAKVLHERSPDVCFCFVSGAGTDASEKGFMMWARVKGKAENALRRVGFGRLHLFRPGFIQSARGKSPRGAVSSAIVSGVFPLMRAIGSATSNVAIGDAMLALAFDGGTQEILETRDINRLAQA